MQNLKQLTDDFIEWMKYGRETPATNSTIVTYKKVMKLFIEIFGNMDVTLLDKAKIMLIRKYILDRELSETYLYKVLSYLRSFLKYCEFERELPVLHHKNIKLPKRKKKTVEYFTDEEISELIQHLRARTRAEIRFYALFTFLLESGLRLSEALSLNREDIDFEEKRAIVKGKGGKVRMVLFFDWSSHWLQKYLDKRKDDHEALFVNYKRTQDKVQRLSANTAGKHFSRLQALTGNKKLKAHTLRRTAATHLWKKGADVKTIQKFLGHESLQYTEKYLGTDWERVREVYERHIQYIPMKVVHSLGT